MRNDKGQEITEAGPSTPVEITGLTEVPEAGELFEAVEDERLARELADKRTTEAKEKQFAAYTKVTLDNLFDQMAANDMKELPIIVKADVQAPPRPSSRASRRSPTRRSASASSMQVSAPSPSPMSLWLMRPTPSSSASMSAPMPLPSRGRADRR